MIIQFNGNKLTRTIFFQNLVTFLSQDSAPTLREIRAHLPNEPHLDRKLEELVQGGYVVRENKRYFLQLSLLGSLADLTLDSQVFVDDQSQIYQDLLHLSFETVLTNATNDVKIEEVTDFGRDSLTLSNYFYRLSQQLPLSEEQQALYELLGDVNPEYFLKHATTFLLKFGRKDHILQKRPNIFVDALALLGYIAQGDDGKYSLKMIFNQEELTFTVKKD